MRLHRPQSWYQFQSPLIKIAETEANLGYLYYLTIWDIYRIHILYTYIYIYGSIYFHWIYWCKFPQQCIWIKLKWLKWKCDHNIAWQRDLISSNQNLVQLVNSRHVIAHSSRDRVDQLPLSSMSSRSSILTLNPRVILPKYFRKRWRNRPSEMPNKDKYYTNTYNQRISAVIIDMQN